MATAPMVAIRAVRHLYGTVIPREEFPEAASTTFKAGAPVVAAAGFINEAGADPALVLGIATKDGGNKTPAGAAAQVIEVALPEILFMGNLSNAAGTAVTAVADRVAKYGLAKEAVSGKWYVDKGEVTTLGVTIWNFWLQDKDVIGDVRGRVIFSFRSAVCQASS